jgi:hypothetical protein
MDKPRKLLLPIALRGIPAANRRRWASEPVPLLATPPVPAAGGNRVVPSSFGPAAPKPATFRGESLRALGV